MTTHEPSAVRRDAILCAALALLAIGLRLIPGPRLIDDAYITYRYAKNIIDGAGFVYNPGQNVLGTTTPLYTLLLAAIGSVTGSAALPIVSPIINALADGIGAAVLYMLGKRLLEHRLPALIVAFLWALSPASITFAIGGMETSVAITLMLGTFAAYAYQRPKLAAALTGFALLTRPDTLIWAGPLGIAMIAERWAANRDQPLWKRLPLTGGAIFAGIAAPWIVFAWLTFGSPLPHSMSAKIVAYIVQPTQGLVIFVQTFATPFHEFTSFGATGAIVGFALYLPLSALGCLYLIHRKWRNAPIALFPWVYATTFALANPLIFRWYTAPSLPIYFLTIVSGAWGLATRIGGQNRARWALATLGVAWTLLSMNEWRLHPDHGPDRPAPDMAWHQLELLYQQAALSLKPLIKENTVIAAGDIGAMGWFSEARILDTLGLISPEATRYYPIDPAMLGDAPYSVAPDLIIDQQPDYVVILETYGRNGLLKDPRFKAMYRLREKIETDIYSSDGMLIFERIDLSGGS